LRSPTTLTRRAFLIAGIHAVPTFGILRQSRPQLLDGIQIGDPLYDRAIVWARTDRNSRLIVEYATTESFLNSRRIQGPVATAMSDFTTRVDLRDLPPGQRVFIRVTCEDESGRGVSEPVRGSFVTASTTRRDIRFFWSADTVGQGYGINPDLGGMRIYETMREMRPDFFIHSGDTIYADGPVSSELTLADGSKWRNVTTEAKSKVAETLDEYRGCYRYNLLDENLRKFNSEVPQIWQWDDHEVRNNWSPGTNLQSDDRYKVKDIRTLVQRARQAFFEYAPVRATSSRSHVYRRIPYGPLLDVFVLDLRSYRAANNYNRQERESPETAFLGRTQLQWLRNDLKRSRAVWKVIASDMPIGVAVTDGRDSQDRMRYENVANGNGPAQGRELEIARLLSFMKRNKIHNVIWLTGDVHYTAAHYYDPAKAQFKDFDPFWEFISGPLNAGTFGPNAVDDTFGTQVIYQKTPQGPKPENSPKAGLQFFGEVFIEAESAALTVNLRDMTGTKLFSQRLDSHTP
jgi:alkaline phosphatase D